MNRRQWMMLSGAAAALPPVIGRGQLPQTQVSAETAVTPDRILLKDYRPKSIYKIPVSDIKKAKYPILDVHCHGARPIERLPEWVKLMDAVGVEKAVIFMGTGVADRFAEAAEPYRQYSGRFELWCGFDMAGNDEPGFEARAVKALEECHKVGVQASAKSATRVGASPTVLLAQARVAVVPVRTVSPALRRRAARTPTTLAWTHCGRSAHNWACR